MLLTRQQRFLLDALARLGCARQDQLTALVRARFCRTSPETAERLTEAMLRQLSHGNCELRVEGGLVRLPRIRADPARLEAIDVMLELSGCAPLDFCAGQSPPVLLRFAAQGKKIHLFAVLTADSLTDVLYRRPSFQSTERVIFLLGDAGAPPALPAMPNKRFFAAVQADGSHRFFEAAT